MVSLMIVVKALLSYLIIHASFAIPVNMFRENRVHWTRFAIPSATFVILLILYGVF